MCSEYLVTTCQLQRVLEQWRVTAKTPEEAKRLIEQGEGEFDSTLEAHGAGEIEVVEVE